MAQPIYTVEPLKLSSVDDALAKIRNNMDQMTPDACHTVREQLIQGVGREWPTRHPMAAALHLVLVELGY